MRLENEHTDTVIEQVLSLLDAMERRALGLSATNMSQLIDDAATLRMYCASLRAYSDMSETLGELEALFKEIGTGQVAISDKVGGVCLHAIATFRHLISGRRTERLVKVLGDLKRVIATIRAKNRVTDNGSRLTETVTEPVTAPAAASGSDSVSESIVSESKYRDLFFADSSLVQLQALAMQLENAPQSLDETCVNECFRLIHTLKGNAALIGFSEIAEYAHAVEDILKLVREGEITRNQDTALFLAASGRNMKALLDARRASQPANPKQYINQVITFAEAQAQKQTESETENSIVSSSNNSNSHSLPPTPTANSSNQLSGFYLRLKISGRELMVPCQSIADVLRKPAVMALPGGRKGWSGLIRSRGNLVPLVEASALVSNGNNRAEPQPWVIVLMGKHPNSAEASLFAVPAEDVHEVVEFPFENESAAILDLAKINIWD